MTDITKDLVTTGKEIQEAREKRIKDGIPYKSYLKTLNLGEFAQYVSALRKQVAEIKSAIEQKKATREDLIILFCCHYMKLSNCKK